MARRGLVSAAAPATSARPPPQTLPLQSGLAALQSLHLSVLCCRSSFVGAPAMAGVVGTRWPPAGTAAPLRPRLVPGVQQIAPRAASARVALALALLHRRTAAVASALARCGGAPFCAPSPPLGGLVADVELPTRSLPRRHVLLAAGWLAASAARRRRALTLERWRPFTLRRWHLLAGGLLGLKLLRLGLAALRGLLFRGEERRERARLQRQMRQAATYGRAGRRAWRLQAWLAIQRRVTACLGNDSSCITAAATQAHIVTRATLRSCLQRVEPLRHPAGRAVGALLRQGGGKPESGERQLAAGNPAQQALAGGRGVGFEALLPPNCLQPCPAAPTARHTGAAGAAGGLAGAPAPGGRPLCAHGGAAHGLHPARGHLLRQVGGVGKGAGQVGRLPDGAGRLLRGVVIAAAAVRGGAGCWRAYACRG